jgi:hypothetical protein
MTVKIDTSASIFVYFRGKRYISLHVSTLAESSSSEIDVLTIIDIDPHLHVRPFDTNIAFSLISTINTIRFLITINFCRLCGLVVTAPDYRSRGPSSIPGATAFSE